MKMQELAIEMLNKGFKKTEYVDQGGLLYYSIDVINEDVVRKIHNKVTNSKWDYEDENSDYYFDLKNEYVTLEVMHCFSSAQYCFLFKDMEEFKVYDIEHNHEDYNEFLKLVRLLPDVVKVVGNK